MSGELLFHQAQDGEATLRLGAEVLVTRPPEELLFDALQDGSASLVFKGDEAASGGGDSGERVATLAATLPGLQGAALVTHVLRVSLAAALPGLSLAASARYKSNTERPLVGRTRARHETGTPAENGARGAHDAAAPLRVMNALPHQDAARLSSGTPIAQQDAARLHALHRAAQQDAARVLESAAQTHQDAARAVRSVVARAQDAARLSAQTAFWQQDGRRVQRVTLSRVQDAQRAPEMRYSGVITAALPLSVYCLSLAQDARRPPAGLSILPPAPPAPPFDTPCHRRNGALLFASAWDGSPALLFRCDDFSGGGGVDPQPGTTVVVSVQRVYIVVNNISLRRASDNASVPCIQFGLSIDANSWTWGFDATLPPEAQAQVEPINGPVALLAHVNGQDYKVLAEQVSRERVFGQVSIRVTGRGANAVLDAPYAPQQTFANGQARTAQQLMADVLTLNGVSMGWTVDWGLTDWLVPAGAWAHQGTFASALNAIAGAAGAYIQPDPIAQTLRVRHRYPSAPWAWGSVTPDIVLPADVAQREGIAWVSKPVYNRVYVHGERAGVMGRVTRVGTTGDKPAPMVVDSLITEAPAARQRGLVVLADTGDQIEESLRLPVLAATGVITPGKFVRYTEGSAQRLGLVRSTKVEAAFPEVWQTIGVQCHA